MALSEEDLQAIGRLIDERVGRIEARDRRRRRFWAWFWVIFIVLNLVGGWWSYVWVRERVRDYVVEQDERIQSASREYQKALAANAQLRRERDQAVQATGYHSGQPQATYEAGLMAQAIRAIGRSRELNKKLEKADLSDPEQLARATEELSATIDGLLGPVGQILLRNSDPAHMPKPDVRQRDAASSATPATPVLEPR